MQGAHIALLGPNCAAWISAFFAVVSGGCTSVHLGTPTDELASCLSRADVSLLLSALKMQELHECLQTLDTDGALFFPELKYDDTAALYFTSGTTAQSKYVTSPSVPDRTHHRLPSGFADNPCRQTL